MVPKPENSLYQGRQCIEDKQTHTPPFAKKSNGNDTVSTTVPTTLQGPPPGAIISYFI